MKIGTIIQYNTTEAERNQMQNGGTKNGIYVSCNTQKTLPAIVVAIWGEGDTPTLNARVIVDGMPTYDLWKTSIQYGDGEGFYSL